MMLRRTWLSASAACGAGIVLPTVAAPPSTLRVLFSAAETGFDPPQIPDENSSMVAACIFDALLTYDYVARPVALVPQTAAALPEVSADFRSFTFRVRPGIFFADDPAFHRASGGAVAGGRRELVAEDYVYSVKRFFDPKVNSEHLYIFENAGLPGLAELRAEAQKPGRRFDYDRPVEGIRALDRYTLRVRVARPSPRLVYHFANAQLTGAVAREVVETYGDDIGSHPVGTGPYRLGAWRRASRLVLERSPTFREQRFTGTPAPGDAQAERVARELAGRRLPLADRIEISVIDEAQPRWLAFLNGQADHLELPREFAPIAVPGDALAPHLAKRGVKLQRGLQPDIAMTYFNMEDPLVGGLAPAQVALRRAVALAYRSDEDIRNVRNGQAVPAQSIVAPFTSGYDAAYRSEMGATSRARAMALLDLYGFDDRDGDGWRETPAGRPLVLRKASGTSQRERALNDVWRKNLAAIGVRIEFEIATWPDLLKKSRAGGLMMWGFSWIATTPDGGFFLGLGYGPNARESNDAHFALPAYDRLFERQDALPDGPGRDAVMRRAKDMLVAYMPYKVHAHTIVSDLLQPRVRGFWRHPFMRDLWRYVGVDEA